MNGMIMTTQRAEADAFDLYYGRLAAALGELKGRLQRLYERRFPGEEERIRREIEKAERAAWQTPFPQLFFPDLAEEAIEQL
ncbi:MAG TPA: hypothetical protein VIS99_08305, partial [Terrimicrobiaceae bacterium]